MSNDSEQRHHRQRTLVVQDGEIGILKHGDFQSHSNFCIEVLHAVWLCVYSQINWWCNNVSFQYNYNCIQFALKATAS